jgi:hypothetical protein
MMTVYYCLYILSVVDPCFSDPCQNGGSCISGRGRFVCLPTPPSTGSLVSV